MSTSQYRHPGASTTAALKGVNDAAFRRRFPHCREKIFALAHTSDCGLRCRDSTLDGMVRLVVVSNSKRFVLAIGKHMGNIRRVFARKGYSGHRWRSYFGVLSLAIRWASAMGPTRLFTATIARCATARSSAPSSGLSSRTSRVWIFAGIGSDQGLCDSYYITQFARR